MKKDFNDIPNDPDTHILIEQEGVLDDFQVLYQAWVFDGIRAESIIFHAEDVKELSDEDLIAQVKESPLVKPDSEFTISRKQPKYTFVNFNFEIKD